MSPRRGLVPARPRRRAAALLTLALTAGLLALSGCGDASASKSKAAGATAPAGIYADRVIAYDPINSQGTTEADWPYFFHSDLALGAPGGYFDVASLGYDPAASNALGGTLTLGIGNAGGRRCVVDGPGDDLVVYENAFRTSDGSGNPGTNTEVGLVEVSADAATWLAFPVSVNAALPLIDPARYAGFFGTLPTDEGGNRFDLADVIAANGLPAAFAACYVRLTDGGTRYADYGNTQTDLTASGADVDAIEALHSQAAPGQVP